MYNLGDMAGAFNPEEQKKSLRTPRLPKTDVNYSAVLKRITEEEGDTSGKFFQAVFQVTKSDSPAVLEGAIYTIAFFQGASKVDRAKCWKKITPLVMACAGLSAADVDKVPAQLCEFLELSGRPNDKDAANKGSDLDLAFNGSRKLEEARPDKDTGVIDPEYLEKDGKPKKFTRDDFSIAAN